MRMGALASIINVEHLIQTAGYPLLFLIVMSESSGAPVPGETGLIAAAVLASQAKLKIELVIPLAAAGAIVGDNIGYLIGRKGGRWLLERPGPFHSQRLQVLATGEPFFERHGPKAVFFGRFVLGLRVWASWLAGATHMRWRLFFLWNALGGITWATAIGLAAYFLGHSAGGAVEAFGLYGLVALAIAVGSVLIAHRRNRRHHPPTHESGDTTLTAPRAATEDLGDTPTQAAPGDSGGG
jgi:membrane protein DedA with SNARE-associated domain